MLLLFVAIFFALSSWFIFFINWLVGVVLRLVSFSNITIIGVQYSQIQRLLRAKQYRHEKEAVICSCSSMGFFFPDFWWASAVEFVFGRKFLQRILCLEDVALLAPSYYQCNSFAPKIFMRSSLADTWESKIINITHQSLCHAAFQPNSVLGTKLNDLTGKILCTIILGDSVEIFPSQFEMVLDECFGTLPNDGDFQSSQSAIRSIKQLISTSISKELETIVNNKNTDEMRLAMDSKCGEHFRDHSTTSLVAHLLRRKIASGLHHAHHCDNGPNSYFHSVGGVEGDPSTLDDDTHLFDCMDEEVFSFLFGRLGGYYERTSRQMHTLIDHLLKDNNAALNIARRQYLAWVSQQRHHHETHQYLPARRDGEGNVRHCESDGNVLHNPQNYPLLRPNWAAALVAASADLRVLAATDGRDSSSSSPCGVSVSRDSMSMSPAFGISPLRSAHDAPLPSTPEEFKRQRQQLYKGEGAYLAALRGAIDGDGGGGIAQLAEDSAEERRGQALPFPLPLEHARTGFQSGGRTFGASPTAAAATAPSAPSPSAPPALVPAPAPASLASAPCAGEVKASSLLCASESAEANSPTPEVCSSPLLILHLPTGNRPIQETVVTARSTVTPSKAEEVQQADAASQERGTSAFALSRAPKEPSISASPSERDPSLKSAESLRHAHLLHTPDVRVDEKDERKQQHQRRRQRQMHPLFAFPPMIPLLAGNAPRAPAHAHSSAFEGPDIHEAAYTSTIIALVKEARENMIFRDPDDVVVTLEKAAQATEIRDGAGSGCGAWHVLRFCHVSDLKTQSSVDIPYSSNPHSPQRTLSPAAPVAAMGIAIPGPRPGPGPIPRGSSATIPRTLLKALAPVPVPAAAPVSSACNYRGPSVQGSRYPTVVARQVFSPLPVQDLGARARLGQRNVEGTGFETRAGVGGRQRPVVRGVRCDVKSDADNFLADLMMCVLVHELLAVFEWSPPPRDASSSIPPLLKRPLTTSAHEYAGHFDLSPDDSRLSNA